MSDAPIVRDVGVVVVAGGGSSRTGGGELKQLRWVAGKPMLLHSLQLFQSRPDVAMVVCVLPNRSPAIRRRGSSSAISSAC